MSPISRGLPEWYRSKRIRGKNRFDGQDDSYLSIFAGNSEAADEMMGFILPIGTPAGRKE
jgi:hypothetical protein